MSAPIAGTMKAPKASAESRSFFIFEFPSRLLKKSFCEAVGV